MVTRYKLPEHYQNDWVELDTDTHTAVYSSGLPTNWTIWHDSVTSGLLKPLVVLDPDLWLPEGI